MNSRLRIIILIVFPLLLAGVILIDGDRGKTMAKTEHLETIHAVLPPIDRNIPAIIETATFALG